LFCVSNAYKKKVKVNSKWGILKSPRQLVKILFSDTCKKKNTNNNNNNDKPHPKSSNELLVCNLPLTLSLPKTMHATGIHARDTFFVLE